MVNGVVPSPFTDEEYEAFIACVRDPWTPERHPDDEYDVIITHPNGREILINTARNRIAYRDTNTDNWGLRQKPVPDLEQAATKLMTVALNVDMNEMHYLGITGHPEQPTDADYSNYDPDADDT